MGVMVCGTGATAATPPAAFAEVAGRARIDSAEILQSDKVGGAGVNFTLPLDLEKRLVDTTGGAFESSLDWEGRAALLSGPVPLTAQLYTLASSIAPPGATEAVASVSASVSFLDQLLLEHGGAGPAEGLLTLRFSADARVEVAGTRGLNGSGRFFFFLRSPRSDAYVEIESLSGFGFGHFVSFLRDSRRYWTEMDFTGEGPPGGLVWLSNRQERFDHLAELEFAAYGFDVVLPFVFGEALDYNFGTICQSVAVTTARMEQPFAWAGCKAANSLRLLGVASVTDFEGRRIPDVRIQSLSGIPYSFLPGSIPIPEPATWMMLVAGFGLAGAALRRRRQVPIEPLKRSAA
ncbi:PEPxxWA-CTERM sorting domain-containing protein [Thermaurantiacus sp.]